MAALRRSLLASQVVLFACLAIDTALHPGYLLSRDEGGLSNFGVHARTAPAFTIGFLGCAVLLLVSARRAPDGVSGRRFALALRAVAVALVASAASTYPYRHGVALHALHLAVGGVTMALEALVATWLFVRGRRRLPDGLAIVVALSGGVLAVLASVGVLRVLFAAQLAESAGLGVLLVRAPSGFTTTGPSGGAG